MSFIHKHIQNLGLSLGFPQKKTQTKFQMQVVCFKSTDNTKNKWGSDIGKTNNKRYII